MSNKVFPTDINFNQSILDMGRFNGRVNIVEPESPDAVFKMQERLAVKNKSTEYRNALSGIFEDNLLSKVFFSAENVQILQNGIRAGVYEMSEKKFVIAPQNVDTLKIVMRSIYLQYSEHQEYDVTGQIERLNNLVLNYCVPTVFSEAIGYQKYRLDQSTLVVPLELPQHHDREYKQLQLKRWF
uniref:Minor capsid protein P8 central region domain-containing protein n=1 Tax=viral metagenome TaxID=1070528 RepID=A0A6C0HSZ7_9ZZZZ